MVVDIMVIGIIMVVGIMIIMTLCSIILLNFLDIHYVGHRDLDLGLLDLELMNRLQVMIDAILKKVISV